jgi:hypothetical protein
MQWIKIKFNTLLLYEPLINFKILLSNNLLHSHDDDSLELVCIAQLKIP